MRHCDAHALFAQDETFCQTVGNATGGVSFQSVKFHHQVPPSPQQPALPGQQRRDAGGELADELGPGLDLGFDSWQISRTVQPTKPLSRTTCGNLSQIRPTV